MNYEVRLSGAAERYLSRLDSRTQDRVLASLDRLTADPITAGSKQLTNAGGRRSLRVGGWRIIYRIYEVDRVVYVTAIGPRGEVYRGL